VLLESTIDAGGAFDVTLPQRRSPRAIGLRANDVRSGRCCSPRLGPGSSRGAVEGVEVVNTANTRHLDGVEMAVIRWSARSATVGSRRGEARPR